MKKLMIVLLFCFSIFLIHSCYYDKADLLYPIGTLPACDTAGTISYVLKIQPIFQSQCYGCHTPNGISGGIGMGSYALDKVVASNGRLFGSISHAAGFSPMPKGMPQLTACQLATIQKWINSGTPNN